MENFMIEESGKIIWENHVYSGGIPGILCGAEESDCVSFEVGSGTYYFKLIKK